ncbi:MAG: aminoacyl-histidine dipeptidase [Desulfatitalea sp.]
MHSRCDRILDYFEQINAIPRCSKNEAALCRWLQEWAKARNLATSGDAAGNMVVRLPATRGYEKAPIVVLQAHMDMVCEKTPDSLHDFARDPIRSIRQGDWLTADRTTLGADNGIAIAYALAVAEDETLQRPPLELLFTVDEETGLNGVKKMGPDLIRGRILINLDSEDEGIFTIGCAGGMETAVNLMLATALLPAGWRNYKLLVGGLTGGHSGIDIHKHRANANKLLARTLAALHQENELRIITLTGGSRHNAIARDSEARVATAADTATIERTVAEMEAIVRKEYGDNEAGLFIKTSHDTPASTDGLTIEATERAIWLLLALPHGVAGMSPNLPGVVETSSNLATVSVKAGRLHILSSQRSALSSRLTEITATVRAVAELSEAEAHEENKYPPWTPEMRSPLLQTAKEVYARIFAKEPVIQVIHAGLECAIIGALYPGMQMISLGPTIRSPHSPTERLYIPSVDQVWQLLVALLARLGP